MAIRLRQIQMDIVHQLRLLDLIQALLPARIVDENNATGASVVSVEELLRD